MYECKEWLGSKDECGYGMKRYKGKVWRVHRLVFWLFHRYLPEVVMHICDNPSCYNPAHLIAGDRDKNNKDRAAKHRSADVAGDKHPKALLTNTQVREIKDALTSPYRGINKDLAIAYNCSQDTISNIRRGKQWVDI